MRISRRISSILFQVIILFYITLLVNVFVSWAEEQTINIPITVNVPKASGSAIKAYRVNATASASVAAASSIDANSGINGNEVSVLDFGYLILMGNVWLPRDYFVITVSPIGGAGSPNVVLTYVEGQQPANQTKGLGYKGKVNFAKGDDSAISGHGLKLLREINGETISSAELNGATLKVYVSLISGSSQGEGPLLSRGGEPFKKDDKPGSYNGILTITSTVD